MSQLALAIHRTTQNPQLDMRRVAESEERIDRQACLADESALSSARDALVDKSRGFDKSLATQPAEPDASRSFPGGRNVGALESATGSDAPPEMSERANVWPASERETTREQPLNHENSRDSVEFRFLVRRREAGALIGKRGANIKRLRDCHPGSTFSVPDTGNGPERIVCVKTDLSSQDSILVELTKLLLEKSPENDEQIELKQLIHSSHAGLLIGVGGQSIKKLRNDSRAAIKIYEMCCPLSSERVCAIKAKPPVVVEAVKLIGAIIGRNPPKGTVKPYDALHFNLNLVDKYGGYLPDELLALASASAATMPQQFETGRQGHLVRPCCDLHLPLSDPHNNNRQQQNPLDPMPPLAFPFLSSQLRFAQQRKPKHFATIWRAADNIGPSGGPSTSDGLREPGANCALGPGEGQHQPLFAQRHANLANLRFQRFHPYLDQIRCLAPVYQQQPRVFRQQFCQFMPCNALDDEFSHPSTRAEAYAAMQQFSQANTASSNMIAELRPQPAQLVYGHKHSPLVGSASNQCDAGLVWSLATPQRTGQLSGPRSLGQAPAGAPTGAYNCNERPQVGHWEASRGSHSVLTDSKIN